MHPSEDAIHDINGLTRQEQPHGNRTVDPGDNCNKERSEEFNRDFNSSLNSSILSLLRQFLFNKCINYLTTFRKSISNIISYIVFELRFIKGFEHKSHAG